jgi:hypothetical protein
MKINQLRRAEKTTQQMLAAFRTENFKVHLPAKVQILLKDMLSFFFGQRYCAPGFALKIMDELNFGKEINYILYNCYVKKIGMVKICYGRFGQRILLMIKNCIINLLIKICMRAI